MKKKLTVKGTLRALVIVLAYGTLFLVFETQGASFEAASSLPVWSPASGLHLALLVIYGLAYAPVVLVATLGGGAVLADPAVSLAPLILTSLIVTLGHGAAAVWLRRAGGDEPFEPVRVVKQVAGVAVALPLLIGGLSALVDAAVAGGSVVGAAFVTAVWRGWIGGVTGILTVFPLAMLAVDPRARAWVKATAPGGGLIPVRNRAQGTLFGLELAAIAAALSLVSVAGPAHGYLCLLPVLWIAWRHGLARAALAVFVINIGLAVSAPAPAGGVAGDVQVLMSVVALAGLALGASVSERTEALAARRRIHAEAAACLEATRAALEETRRTLTAERQERRHVEETLGTYIEELQTSHDKLKAAMLRQADLNDKLRASEQQLTDLNARKDKFFSIISHDVKSMLVSAIGFSKLLFSDADTLPRDMLKEFASHVHSSTTNTYDLLENLLTWTRMQTGRIYYQRSWHTVDDLIQNNISMLQTKAVRKGIRVKRRGDREAQVYADRNMINSVLQNLISNAIKFTEHGGEVTVSSRTYDQTVEISVTDNGVGISPENIDKLFRIDVNLSTRGTDNEEGTGLGLVLCKEMIEKHEGHIWAESKPGRGSSFHFTLPCADVAAEDEEAEAA